MSDSTKFILIGAFLIIYVPFMIWVAVNPQWP